MRSSGNRPPLIALVGLTGSEDVYKRQGIDELILTKLDGTAKGGVAVAVSMQYGIPITYVGLGEKREDLRPFNGDDFAKALLEQ